MNLPPLLSPTVFTRRVGDEKNVLIVDLSGGDGTFYVSSLLTIEEEGILIFEVKASTAGTLTWEERMSTIASWTLTSSPRVGEEL
jgi:hypothetical protein